MAVLSWPETAAIAFLSALVESALWTKPRPRWKATVFYGAISVLATSAAYATYYVPAVVPSPLLMVMAAIVYFVVSSIALAKFNARSGSNLSSGRFRTMSPAEARPAC